MLYSVLVLIVDTVAAILAGILLLRFWMQAVRVRPPMSLGQFMYQLTDWLVKPLRRIMPGVAGYDWASLLGAFLVALASVAIVLAVASPSFVLFDIQALLVLSVVKLAQWILYGLMGLIIIEVIFSWVNPNAPLAPLVGALTEPVMRPLRRVIPAIGGVDLSPLVAFLLLRIALFVVDAVLLPMA
ncbi:MAG: YggT family protein [Janthinobacterium lividum]